LSGRASAAGAPVRWVFLDRDGTINRAPPRGRYVLAPSQLRLLPDAGAAIRLLNQARVWTAVVTNQRAIARGEMGTEDLDAVHDRLRAQLELHGARLDAIYHCPHEHGACSCRKPQEGMLLRARREHPGLDFAQAAIVGDNESDVQAGKRVGAGAVLLAKQSVAATDADHVAGTLLEAVEWLRWRRGLAASPHAG
jgi:D-glycero-D-manno-heptose 1,7-bisphosphate phosphatase